MCFSESIHSLSFIYSFIHSLNIFLLCSHRDDLPDIQAAMVDKANMAAALSEPYSLDWLFSGMGFQEFAAALLVV